jgi:hypothetical protein
MTRALLAIALAFALAPWPAAQAAPTKCVGAEEASMHAAGADEDAPPRFTPGFFKRVVTLDASLDGADGRELPVSIEEVCGVPKRLRKQAAQLAGEDGIALLRPRTTVFQGGAQLTGEDAASAIDGADTALLRARLLRPARWREDEDGNQIPTFRTGRVEITD